MKKTMALFLSAGLIATMIAGYSASAADTSASTGTTLTGEVSAISGNSITLALISDNKQDSKGTPPSGTPTQSATDSSETPPSGSPTGTSGSTSDTSTQPSGTAPSGTAPSGTSSGGGGGNGGGMTLTGTTQTITVSDTTTYTTDNMGQSTDATFSDVTVGAILSVSMTDDTVTAVVIRQGMGTPTISSTPTTSKVTVDGETVSCLAYNIGGSNYFKLRDIAQALNGTDKEFEVGYDSTSNAITLNAGSAYTAVGGELTASSSTDSVSATISTVKVTLDDSAVSLTAYNIGGSNYFKLRELAGALDFGVSYDSTTATIVIDTTTGYTAA
jgi:hypothetical protein